MPIFFRVLIFKSININKFLLLIIKTLLKYPLSQSILQAFLSILDKTKSDNSIYYTPLKNYFKLIISTSLSAASNHKTA